LPVPEQLREKQSAPANAFACDTPE
jgi:hypothetical protein